MPQELLSPKTGKGLEHHFPQVYSQVGAGTMDVHAVAEVTFVVKVLKVVSEADKLVNFDVIMVLMDEDLEVEVVACDEALEIKVPVEDETD